MFKKYIYKKSPVQFNTKILIIDCDEIRSIAEYTELFVESGFEVIKYHDDVQFRLKYETRFREPDEKLLVVTDNNTYIPYDVRKVFSEYTISFEELFPKLNSTVLKKQADIDFDILTFAYEKTFANMSSEAETIKFLTEGIYEFAEGYLAYKKADIDTEARLAHSYRDWIEISEKKTKLDALAAERKIGVDFHIVNEKFGEFILENYGKLSTEISSEAPVLVSSAMEFMRDHSNKFAIIVMDGMSSFDWHIIRSSLDGIVYTEEKTMAMIPTTTSVSRQCLLSNKYPTQLDEPWKQSNEKNEFILCAKELGFTDAQIAYGRGFETEFDMITSCGAVIINEIDDMVHSQNQGRVGMLGSVRLMAENGTLAELIRRLLSQGFDIYITSDHGNTTSTGMGLMKNAGVDVETKSRKFLVLKDFADKDKWKDKYEMIEYPKYYLPKEYEYLLCNFDKSMDINGKQVMTHGGISIDEVIVPFIKIMVEDNK